MLNLIIFVYKQFRVFTFQKSAYPMLSNISILIYENKGFVITQIILASLLYMLVKYRFRSPTKNLVLSKKTIQKLINTFEALPIIEADLTEDHKPEKIIYNFSSYDIFNISGKFKSEIKETIEKYGIGTCGPRGFYGTLDIHIELENAIKRIYGKEDAIVYSNHFTCVQSVVSCFCKPKNTVYFHRNASECILRGLSISKSATIAYDNLTDLENKLDKNIPDKYVIIEKFGKNTGVVANMGEIVRLRSKFGFRVIVDESFSMPFLYQTCPEDYKDIDIIIGSLCHGYPSNGAFSCGSIDVIEYQRLSGVGYVFSASLPAFLTRAAICFINHEINYEKIKDKIETAFKYIKNIISDRRSPILLIEVKDSKAAQQELRSRGYVVGVNGEYLRVCLNEDVPEETLREVGKILNGF